MIHPQTKWYTLEWILFASWKVSSFDSEKKEGKKKERNGSIPWVVCLFPSTRSPPVCFASLGDQGSQKWNLHWSPAPPKTKITPQKMMLGRRSFPFEMVLFRGTYNDIPANHHNVFSRHVSHASAIRLDSPNSWEASRAGDGCCEATLATWAKGNSSLRLLSWSRSCANLKALNEKIPLFLVVQKWQDFGILERRFAINLLGNLRFRAWKMKIFPLQRSRFFLDASKKRKQVRPSKDEGASCYSLIYLFTTTTHLCFLHIVCK